jgi:hypothetical protein
VFFFGGLRAGSTLVSLREDTAAIPEHGDDDPEGVPRKIWGLNKMLVSYSILKNQPSIFDIFIPWLFKSLKE